MKDRIVTALFDGQPYSRILAWCHPKVCTKTLQRLRNELKEAIEEAQRKRVEEETKALQRAVVAPQGPDDKPLVRLAEHQMRRRDVWVKKAEAAEDLKALASFDRNELTSMRLVAELTGQLDTNQAPTTNNLTVVLMPDTAAPALPQRSQPQALPDPSIQDAEFTELDPEPGDTNSGGNSNAH